MSGLGRLRDRIAGNLRYKLLVLVLFPVIIVMPTVVGMAYLWSNEVTYRQLLMKVNTDLSVAHDAFIGNQKAFLTHLSLGVESYTFRNALSAMLSGSRDGYLMKEALSRLQREGGFDFVEVVTLDGCDFFEPQRCRGGESALMQRAVAGEAAVAVDLFSAEELRSLSPALAERVYLPLQPTPHAQPTQRVVEDRGMLFHMVSPLRARNGEVKAVVRAGVLVNRNFEFVDSLRDLVYSRGSLVEDSIGTVTVFLDDVRINTNVPRELQSPQQRALGTRVSAQVRDKVLTNGEQWVGRAFVVNEWYISAYEPITDVHGDVVGMLYAGFLEAPFRQNHYDALKFLLVLFVVVATLCIFLAIRGAKSIFKPIESMARVIRKTQQGHDLRIGKLASHDEIGELAAQFDLMLDQLQIQRDQIQAAADQLEVKVGLRTQELKQKTIDLQENINLLQRTRQQLVAKEKLAAIGELAAGIAHEINNPTAVILGNMDLITQELGSAAQPITRETELIIQQVDRIRAIITNLLQYARPGDAMIQIAQVDLNRVVQDALVLVRHDLIRHGVRLQLDLRADRLVGGNHQQFQQVMINLIVNAMHAMATGGRLVVRSRNWHGEGVLLTVRDNGRGIAPDTLSYIFDPFFSRTPGGTGLGLSISQGILQRFGAEVRVRSRVGVGTVFFIWLPCNPEINLEEERLLHRIC